MAVMLPLNLVAAQPAPVPEGGGSSEVREILPSELPGAPAPDSQGSPLPDSADPFADIPAIEDAIADAAKEVEASAPNAPSAPDIDVTESGILSVTETAEGDIVATPASTIPYGVGKSCYEWFIRFAPVEGQLTLTEQLILPGPARHWTPEPGEGTEVNPQRSAATTIRRFDASRGSAGAGWCVAKDDPVGSYRFILRQGEREVARLDFTVGDLL